MNTKTTDRNNCYIDLATAIVLQAEHDYITALKRLKKPNTDCITYRAMADIRRITTFYHSHWGETVMCGYNLIFWNKLQEKVKELGL